MTSSLAFGLADLGWEVHVVASRQLYDNAGANLAKKDAGFNEVPWNGNYSPNTKNNSKGGTKVIADDMPYRVQIQVHTGPDQANGLALAAMSTEVRLYVHPSA